MDEIFGRENFVSLITFTKTSPLVSKLLARRCDYIIWYANDKDKCKYRPLFMRKNLGNRYVHVELKNGERRKMTQEERENPSTLPEGAEPFALDKLQSTGYTKTCYYDFEFEGRLIKRRAHSWQTNKEGMKSLIAANRVWGKGEIPGYVRKYSDFPFQQIDHLWGDSGGAPGMVYVVETNPKIIQRCILMTTDPGDLVFDPTCGSGTTAVVAEQWGRRWITCDASRVALAIARQRLLTANFPYYNLRDERAGVSGGFVCRTVPHITLKSIANQERPPTETLHDQPEVDRKKARIAGPFTVEGLPSPVVVSPEEIKSGVDGALDGADAISSEHASSRHAMWARELADNGARGRDGETVHFSRAEACGAGRYLHLEVETAGAHPQPGFVSFGPQHAPMGSAHVARALEEAALFSPRPKLLVFAAFAFDPQAAKTLDEFNWPGGRIVKATMDPDLHVRDLKRHKRKAGDAAFWLMGRPDAELRLAEAGEGSGEGEEWIVEVRGFDYYNPRKPAEDRLEKGEKENIAMWMLDTDYDGRQLYPRQVFFPLGGKEGGWGRLSRALRAELDAERMEKYRGTVSLPFQLGDFRRAAVKIVDDSGIESIRVLEAPES